MRTRNKSTSASIRCYFSSVIAGAIYAALEIAESPICCCWCLICQATADRECIKYLFELCLGRVFIAGSDIKGNEVLLQQGRVILDTNIVLADLSS